MVLTGGANVSDIKNESASFESRGGWSAYSGYYPDPAGNLWRIDVTGNPTAVGSFVAERPFSLAARPAGEKDLAAAAPADPVASVPEQELPEEESPELPGLDVAFTLQEVAASLRAPYVVAFEIDPCMVDNYDRYSFCLKGSDTTANVSYTSNGGTVQVSVYGSAGYQTDSGSGGSVTVSNVPQRSWWFVSVSRRSGNPCYTLHGDITVL
jgi:hypothetical protein